MATGLTVWSQTAASNSSADSAVNWAEGMAPSAVNDSARAMMASLAKYRDDITGSIATGGTSTAYTVTTNQSMASLAAGRIVAFAPNATNGATVTLNVDGLGAKPLRSAPNTELAAGVLISGTPYVATYYTSNSGEWLLHSFYGDPYGVPLAGLLPYLGTTAPNSSFVFPYGQAVSRTTYATLFALTSTTYGVGDGSTTFNLPDIRGRVIAGQDDMGGTSADRLTNQTGGLDGDTLGATGGSETHTLTTAQLAAHSHGVTDAGHTHNYTRPDTNSNGQNGGSTDVQGTSTQATVSATTGITIDNAGGGGAHNNVQPTIALNYILRVL